MHRSKCHCCVISADPLSARPATVNRKPHDVREDVVSSVPLTYISQTTDYV